MFDGQRFQELASAELKVEGPTSKKEKPSETITRDKRDVSITMLLLQTSPRTTQKLFERNVTLATEACEA